MAPANLPWESRESRVQAVVILLGVVMVFVLGLFPQLMQPILANLPSLFQHLGQ
jgi:hypothetical protein